MYNRHLWTSGRAERFAQALQALATAVAERPQAELGGLPVTSTPERTRRQVDKGKEKAKCIYMEYKGNIRYNRTTIE